MSVQRSPLQFVLVVPDLAVRMGGFVILDPVKVFLGHSFEELFSSLRGGAPVYRDSGGSRTMALPLAIPDGEGVATPIPRIKGDLGLFAEQGNLGIVVPFDFASAVAARLDGHMVAPPRTVVCASGNSVQFLVRCTPGVRFVLDLPAPIGSVGIEIPA